MSMVESDLSGQLSCYQTPLVAGSWQAWLLAGRKDWKQSLMVRLLAGEKL